VKAFPRTTDRNGSLCTDARIECPQEWLFWVGTVRVAYVTKFIEERVKLVRSLAEQADPFIKPRLLALAERYEHQLSRPSTVAREIKMATPLLMAGSTDVR
jgi:hypothetical protein